MTEPKAEVPRCSTQMQYLDGSAHGNSLVGVDALAGRAAEEILHNLLHLGDTRHAAHEKHLSDFGLGDAGILRVTHVPRPTATKHTLRHLMQGSTLRLIRWSTMFSNLERDSFTLRCFGLRCMSHNAATASSVP